MSAPRGVAGSAVLSSGWARRRSSPPSWRSPAPRPRSPRPDDAEEARRSSPRSAASRPLRNRPPARPRRARSGVADWPSGEDGWTIALASLPQTGGRAAGARAGAGAARAKKLTAGRRPRLVALREPPPRLLDRVLRHLRERGRGDECARGRPRRRRATAAVRRVVPVTCRCLRRRRRARLCNTAEKALHCRVRSVRLRSFFRLPPRNSGTIG